MDKTLQEFVGKLLGNRFGSELLKFVHMSRMLNVSLKFCEFKSKIVPNLIIYD